MKARTMVYLEPEQLRALKAEARERNISLAELMRRIVADHLDGRPKLPPVPKEAYMKLVGIGSGGPGDVSERHDDYVGEAIWEELQREHEELARARERGEAESR